MLSFGFLHEVGRATSPQATHFKPLPTDEET